MLRIVVQSLKIGTIAITALLVVFAAARGFDYYRDKAAAEARIGQSVLITIKKSDDAGDVADKMHDGGLINSKLYFEGLLKISGKDLLPGSYTFKIGTSAREIVNLITTEKSVAKTENKDLSITVIEGWRTEQIAEELERLGLNGGAKGFMTAVKNYDGKQFSFLKDRPDKHSLEGYLFPDTYTFKADMPPEDIIQMMLQNFDEKFDDTMRARADDMGLSINEVLVFASLVEREAQVNRERPVIAGVYINRFENGIRLDADPTVQYAVGKSGDWWPELSNDDLFVDSPYNTYQKDGLPPGPIANPGMQSILGVLQPAETDYVYFFANTRDGGDQISHLFAVDPDGQAQNIAYVKGEADTPAPCSDPWADGCVLGGG